MSYVVHAIVLVLVCAAFTSCGRREALPQPDRSGDEAERLKVEKSVDPTTQGQPEVTADETPETEPEKETQVSGDGDLERPSPQEQLPDEEVFPTRTWEDITGNYAVEASFVELKDGKVKLSKTDGKIVTLALQKLSKADQAWVRSATGHEHAEIGTEAPTFGAKLSEEYQHDLSVTYADTGEPVLLVNYDWKSDKQPSVQVLVPAGGEAEAIVAKVSPMFFSSDDHKLVGTLQQYYESLMKDNPHCPPLKSPVTAAGSSEISYETVGIRNSLGKVGAFIVTQIRPKNGPPIGTIAIYYSLESWSDDPAVIHLDLPWDYISEVSETPKVGETVSARVWFRNQKDVTWSETVEWQHSEIEKQEPD